MERLTERDGNIIYYPHCNNAGKCGGHCSICDFEVKVMNKLADYEDAEEQGLLLKLPFPIGKPIYKVCYAKEINDGFVYETVMSLKFYADNIKDFENGIIYITKEEAEQALAGKKEV